MNASARFALLSLLIILLAMIALIVLTQYLTVGNIAYSPQSLPFYGVTGVVGLVLWGLLQLVARGAIEGARQDGLAEGRASAPKESIAKPAPQPKPEPPKPAAPTVDKNALIESGAAQMLAILQRKGRLIDFLQEDLSAYQDAQIGAAVRNIHQESKSALAEAISLEPVFAEAEGSSVTVQPGFDANAIRLSGNVSGNPPFTGSLRHRGWKISSFNLPQRTGSDKPDPIIAVAEVEVS